MKPGTNFNHPKAGSTTLTDPIKKIEDIAKIREFLKNKPRDLCLFTMGINTNLRIGDLLSLTIGQVSSLKTGDPLTVRQKKTRKYGIRTINRAVRVDVENWLKYHPNPVPDAALFPGKDGYTPLTVPTASRLVKHWCKSCKLRGHFAAHTLRKTFGYHSRVTFKMPLEVITAAFNHKSPETTLAYLCIQPTEVKKLFMNEL